MKSSKNLQKRVIEIGMIVILSCILFLACNRGSSGNEILISTNQKDGTASAEGSEELSREEERELSEGTRENGEISTDEEANQTSEDESKVAGKAPEEDFEEFLYVYVCGEVESPGLYKLSALSRAMAAVEAAGGFTENAGRNSLNLAQILTDGSMIRIPTLEEEKNGTVSEITESGSIPASSGAVTSENGENRVNINTADSETLCTIPGIGEAKAKEIVRYREQNGLFASPEDLMNVPGIKSGTFDKIREYVKTE